MKNLNQLFKLPILRYPENWKYTIEKFDDIQLEKLYEEIEEYVAETDDIKKCCELFDIIQVVFSLLENFNKDTIDQAYRLNLDKHKCRKKFDIVGNYDIFKMIKK